jgi:hypothetical protein
MEGSLASTSIHLPDQLLQRLDRLATERRTSRNRLIVEACEALVAAGRGDWPAGFFDPVDPDDLALLREAGVDMEAAIYAARRDRAAVPEL